MHNTQSTNFSPYEITCIFGRKIKTPFTNKTGKLEKYVTTPTFVQNMKVNLDLVQKQILEAKKEMRPINTTAKRPYTIGMTVMVKILPEVRGIKHPRYAGPYKIVGKKGDCWGYVLEDKERNRVERNVHHLKPITPRKKSTKILTSVESAFNEMNSQPPAGHRLNGGSPCNGRIYQPLRQSIQESRYPNRQRSQPVRYGYCRYYDTYQPLT